jgi:hypothetical protein
MTYIVANKTVMLFTLMLSYLMQCTSHYRANEGAQSHICVDKRQMQIYVGVVATIVNDVSLLAGLPSDKHFLGTYER